MFVSQYLRILWARKWLLLVTFLVIAATGIAITLLIPRQYTAETSLVVEMRIDPALGALAPALASPSYMQTQIEILKSERVATRATAILGIERSPYLVKQYREAEALFQKGYLLNPKSFRIGNDWAWFMTTCPDVAFRNASKAVSLIKPVVECWPNPEYLDTLAAAYAESRDFKAASCASNQMRSCRHWALSGES